VYREGPPQRGRGAQGPPHREAGRAQGPLVVLVDSGSIGSGGYTNWL